MNNIFNFEIKLFKYRNVLILSLIATIFIFLVSIAFNFNDKSKILLNSRIILENYYMIFSQFYFLSIIPAVCIYSIAYDYSVKTIVFYYQNNVNKDTLFSVRNLIISIFCTVINVLSFMIYLCIYNFSIDINVIFFIFFIILVTLYSIQIMFLFTNILKKISISMFAGICFWIIVQIIGSLFTKLRFFSGKASLIDGNCYLATCLSKYLKSSSLAINYFLHGSLIGVFWVIFLLFINMFIVKNKKF